MLFIRGICLKRSDYEDLREVLVVKKSDVTAGIVDFPAARRSCTLTPRTEDARRAAEAGVANGLADRHDRRTEFLVDRSQQRVS
jgi:hypothetical protein